MEDIIIAIIPAVLAFWAAIWKSKHDLEKQRIIHEAKLIEIKEEAIRDRDNFETRLKEMKAKTDEELRKADAALERKFIEEFTNPTNFLEQIEGLTKGFEAFPKLQEQIDAVDKMNKRNQAQKGWTRN